MIRYIKIYSFIIVVIFNSCNSYSSYENRQPELITTLNEGKSFIDSQMSLLINEFNVLCKLKRNEQLKEKYLLLRSKILDLNEMGFKLVGLSSAEQIELVKYVSEKIKENKKLNNLAYSGKISCW